MHLWMAWRNRHVDSNRMSCFIRWRAAEGQLRDRAKRSMSLNKKQAAKGGGSKGCFLFWTMFQRHWFLKLYLFHKNENMELSTTIVPTQLSRAYPAGDFLVLDDTPLQKYYYIAFGNLTQFWKVTFKMASCRMIQRKLFASRNNPVKVGV